MASALQLVAIIFVVLQLQVVLCRRCEDYQSSDTTTCPMLFEKFQAALVGNDLNLYNLRKTFSPASRPAPVLVNVSYDISIGYIPENPCPGIGNDALFNISNTPNFNYGWTSTAFYTLFHPAELNRMQPQLIFIFVNILEEANTEEAITYVTTAFTWDGTERIITAKLSLSVPSLPCLPSEQDVYNTIWDITALLKIYAEIQDNITTWKTGDAGNVLNGNALSDRWWESDGFDGTVFISIFHILSNILAVIVTSVVLCIIRNKSQKSTDPKFFHSVRWITVAVIAQCNIMFLLADFVQIVIWCHSDCGGVALLKLVWFFYLFLFSAISILISFIIYTLLKIDAKKTSGIDKWNILVCAPCAVFSFLGCFFQADLKFCKPLKNVCEKCVVYLFCMMYIPTIFVFVSLVLTYLLPVLFLLVEYPFEVIPAYSFLITALILYTLIAIYADRKRKLWDEERSSGKRNTNICEPSLYFLLAQFNVMFIIITSLIFIVAYTALVAGGLSNNPIMNSFFSLLPSIILSVLIWLFKHKVLNKSAVDGATQTTNDDQSSESATDSNSLVINDRESDESDESLLQHPRSRR